MKVSLNKAPAHQQEPLVASAVMDPDPQTHGPRNKHHTEQRRKSLWNPVFDISECWIWLR